MAFVQSKTISQHSLAANGHPTVQSQFSPMRCEQWESVFKGGQTELAWAISPTPLCPSLAWNTQTRQPGRGGGGRAGGEKRAALVAHMAGAACCDG